MFNQKIQSKSMQEAMATDPSMMVDMLKKSLSGMVPQVIECHGILLLHVFMSFVFCVTHATLLASCAARHGNGC